MRLLVSDLDSNEILIAINPTESQIADTINSLNWKLFQCVTLKRDSNNWIVVSGSLEEDGLAIIYEENGS